MTTLIQPSQAANVSTPSTEPDSFLGTAVQERQWMGSEATPETADWVLVGLPYDGTTSFRPGTRFGPAAIREASWGVECYSPRWDLELSEDVRFYDAGELLFPMGNRELTLKAIGEAAKAVIAAKKRWFGIGGEHLVTYPVIEEMVKVYPDLAVLHFDAHADLREDYLGEPLSHATVLRRVADLIGGERLIQVGIRSGERVEFEWMRENQTLLHAFEDVPRALERLQGRPVFVTVDLDVLDPSVFPGTGTPEPGGFTVRELFDWFQKFEGLRVVGADAVELSPHYDTSGVSTVTAAKVIREMLLWFAHNDKQIASL